MSKIVFFGIPARGHINPTLSVVKLLVEKGNTVYYYATKKFKSEITATGAVFCPYENYEEFDFRIAKNISKIFPLLLDVTEKEVPEFLKKIAKENPDCIIHDSVAFWGKIISQQLNIPAISMVTTFALTKRVLFAYPGVFYKYLQNLVSQTRDNYKNIRRFNRILKKYKLRTSNIFDLFINQEKLNIVFTSRVLQPLGWTLGEKFVFVGPSIASRIQDADFLNNIKTKEKIIYISLGTVFNDDIVFYRICLEAFKDKNYQMILSIGQHFTAKDLLAIPKNFIVRNYVPQPAVLNKASLFITHAGMNSINESLYFGVPMLCIPQIEEQKINALRVKQLGAGIVIKEKNMTKKVLFETAEHILHTQSFYTHAANIQRSLRSAGGYKKAADEITAYISKSK